MTRTIYRERIPSTDPRLKRHIHHDSESRRYAFDTSGLSITSVRHTRRIPILDQGNLGSCTGNAGIGCLGTEPFYATAIPLLVPNWSTPEAMNAAFKQAAQNKVLVVQTTGVSAEILADRTPHYALDETGAVQLYSDATKIDDAPGQYPPDDTGSDGLSIAKVLKSAGEISGYQHTFALDDALKALSITPYITGVNWYNDMFNPDPDGRVHITGSLAGGHEFDVDECDAVNERIWFANSWGPGWGVAGRAYLTFQDYGALLSRQGDVTIFTPLPQPAPTPTPQPPDPADPDHAFAAVLRGWDGLHHVGHNEQVARASRAWRAAKGL